MAKFSLSLVLLLLFYIGKSHGLPVLEKVSMVIRHGERTPLFYGAIEEGITELILTNAGKLQGFALGQWLRERYPTLIKKEYDHEEILAHSSQIGRCIMTIQVVLAGLYHPLGEMDDWSGEYNIAWTPIPVNILDSRVDHMLYPIRTEVCPKLEYILEETMVYIEKYYPDFKSLMNKNMDILILRRALTSFYKLYYLTPNGRKMLSEIMEYFTEYTDINRLYTGMLLKDIVTEFNNGTRKMTLYGGHDSTLFSLLYGMKLAKPQKITYLSTLIFEQYFDEENWQRYIKILFLNDNRMTYLRLEGCPDLCPQEQFETKINYLLPSDIEKECHVYEKSDDSI